jgi:hypothetical protein
VFVPLLVDDLHRFLEAFEGHDFWGFSCTIPHKEAAFAAASSSAGCDPVAAQIGAVNTLIRQPPAAGSSGSSGSNGGSSKVAWRGYNTDWLAAISAIERVLAAGSSDAAAVTSSSSSSSSSSSDGSSPLQGKTVCVVGAGGAGRALAFGAVSKGAKVLIANRWVWVGGGGRGRGVAAWKKGLRWREKREGGWERGVYLSCAKVKHFQNVGRGREEDAMYVPLRAFKGLDCKQAGIYYGLGRRAFAWQYWGSTPE